LDIHELRKMPLPKLRELAKQTTDLEGVMGMKKEALVAAIAKAQGISLGPATKDLSTMTAIKQRIRSLRKQRDELLAASADRQQLKRIRREIKSLKRKTRELAAAAKATAGRGAAPATP
jgi:hypothetical protein